MLRVAFVLLAGSLVASGAAQAVRPDRGERAERSYLHVALLDRAPVIVRARFAADDTLHPLEVQVTRFDVVTVLRGPAMTSLLVGAMGERGAAFKEVDKLLFLQPLRSGLMYEVVDVVDLVPSEDPAAVGAVSNYLALDKEPNPMVVRQKLRDLSFRGLESGSVFTTRTAIRELEWLVRRAPQLFGAGELSRLQKVEGHVPAVDKDRFKLLLERVGEALTAGFAGCEAAFDEGAERDAFRRFVTAFRSNRDAAARVVLLDTFVEQAGRRMLATCEVLLQDAAEPVRTRAAWYLGEFGGESTPALLRGLDKAAGDELRARLEALGKIGDADAVPELRKRIPDAALLDVVLLALARIGGAEATEVIERIEAKLQDVAGEEERVARIRSYRTPEFAKDEARRRNRAHQRWSR